MRGRVIAVAAAAAFVLPSEGTATTLPPSFQESTVISGLTYPTAVRFSPDGRVFVAEQSGIIKVFPGLGGTPTVFADLRAEVTVYEDRGLLGLALDPNFPTSPYVYALYTRDAAIGGTPPTWGDDCPTPPGPTTDGCRVSGRLVRLTATGNVATGTQVLLDGWCQQYTSHSIGDLHFGPDGALYVSAGDGASFTFADYGQAGSPRNPCGDPPVAVGGIQQPPGAEGGALRSQSLRRPAGQPALLNGAVLRIDPATGAGLPDNPLAGSADANARRIVAYGMRNPFRFTLRPGTSELWIGDVGWNDWEEIDRAPSATDATVENFGWPCYEGNGAQSGYQSANLTLCQTLYSSGTVAAPLYTYSHGATVVPGETCPAGSSSISGMAFYGSGAYPTAYNGALFFGDYSRNCIWAMATGTNGLPDPTKITTFGAGAPTPVDLEIGPNNDLFYVDIAGGTVREIKYLGGNRPPVATATADVTNGTAPLTVSFDGSTSSDPDPGDTIAYAWDLNGDGVYGDSTVARPTYTYQTPGTYTVRLRVTDSHAASSVSSPITITASNSPPVPVIQTPVSTFTWKVGDTISYSGSASDAQDGALPASALSWTILLQHCPSNCHTHVLQTIPGAASGSFNAPDHDYPSYLTLQLTATDSYGTSTTTSVDLQPQTVVLSFDASPRGLKLVVGPTASTTPFNRTVIAGSQNSVSASTPQALGGTVYDFSSWSDAGAQTHTIVAGTSPSTYTASYVVSPNQTDVTPPTVAMTAPAANATVSGAVTLSANAADDVGVAGVQFQVDGVNLGMEVGSPPYSTQWTATGLPNGTHTLTAIARDAVGHTTPASIAVYVANGLVGAWALDEGLGSSAADSSGKGNGGTVAGATWTTGKYGGALSFTGAPTSWVTVADSASLDLSTASTLEAWVSPTALGTGWRTVLFKEQPSAMVYSLYANDGAAARPLGQLNIGGEQNAEGAATLPLNTWTHLAATWDGATLKLWVNGALAGSKAVAGTLTNSAGVLRMGGNGIWNEWFAGKVDEPRVYNRALAQAEIQADMNRAIRVSGPDTTPPAVAISAPANNAAVRGTVTVTASASDDVGVAGVQFKLDGQNLGAEVTSPPYSVAWNTSAAAGTHRLSATARDAAGNPATAVDVVVTVDNTPPTAAVTAPSAGATVSGANVTLAATATDTVAVAAVQFKVDGANVGSEDATSPYSIIWDSTSVSNGSHLISAVSRDTAGNTATSGNVSVTVSNGAPPPPTGLVAAYGLNETTGTNAADFSGKGNVGTTTNVTWTAAGKYGGAATFNGGTSWITVNDANTLDLTTGMTLEAWVYPTALGTGWRTVIFKEKPGGMVYSLYANDSTQRALAQLNIGGELNAWSLTQLPLNAWSHIAGTWDGATLRFWVNGALAGSTAATGTLANSTGVLRLGGNAIWNEWFAGRIDEVRVYNRALTQAELQADMATAVR